MKKRALVLLPLAAALALSGCGGSDTAADKSDSATQPAEQSAPAQNTEAASPEASAVLTSEQATAIVKKLAGDSEDAIIMDGDTLAASIPQAQKLIEQMEIKPKKCAEFVSQQNIGDLSGINMAAATVPGSNPMQATSYSVAGYEDASKLDKAKELASSKDLQGCDKFTMSIAGQEVEAGAKILDATSDADVTYVSTSTVKMGGQEVPGGSYQIQGIVGSNVIAIGISGDESESEDKVVKQLTEEMNKAVAEVKAAAK
ncbi:hypothetical protein AUR04nite_20580 [Glutamicibacter uratoxydans]|uniref:Lipoprotein n=1 Tax=Glutamicibacter uratoxydans TaxID=43667 RepID=A0A4Y4DNL9_GLUUR|nr:hypothetical protein [Glutamicibacter uratoxydans]GED06526.1 hypothetical protein AUR04nite_20580 [Glutamicibacter uratoxydans]